MRIQHEFNDSSLHVTVYHLQINQELTSSKAFPSSSFTIILATSSTTDLLGITFNKSPSSTPSPTKLICSHCPSATHCSNFSPTRYFPKEQRMDAALPEEVRLAAPLPRLRTKSIPEGVTRWKSMVRSCGGFQW